MLIWTYLYSINPISKGCLPAFYWFFFAWINFSAHSYKSDGCYFIFQSSQLKSRIWTLVLLDYILVKVLKNNKSVVLILCDFVFLPFFKLKFHFTAYDKNCIKITIGLKENLQVERHKIILWYVNGSKCLVNPPNIGNKGRLFMSYQKMANSHDLI